MEDSCCFGSERTHLGEGSMDMSFSSCYDALGRGCHNPCVSTTVSVASVGHENEIVAGKKLSDRRFVLVIDTPLDGVNCVGL